MATSKKNKNGRLSKKGTSNSTKKTKGTEKGKTLPGNVGGAKKTNGRKRAEPKAYIDNLNRSRSLKTGKYIKISNKLRKQLIEAKKRSQKRKPKKVKWKVNEYTTAIYSLRNVITNSEFNTTRFRFIDLEGNETITTSENKMLLYVSEETSRIWSVVETIREDTTIISPQFNPFIKEKIDVTKKVKKQRRILTISFQMPPMETNINSGVFYDYLKRI